MIGKGFNRFLCVKSQTAFGTKATGLTQTLVPLRGGGIFEPNPYKTPREDSFSVLPPTSHYYDDVKIVPWSASFNLVNPTSAATTIRDFLRTFFGKEVLAAGPPLTKTYSIYDELIDGATDTATDFYGRALTLHEQCDDAQGAKIYADEVQDAVIEELTFTIRSRGPITVAMRGMASDFQHNQSDISPSYPAGQLFTQAHVKDTVNAGIRIGTANPPVAADNAIVSQAVLTFRQPIRYEPFLGNGSTKQVRHPVRNGPIEATLEATMDVQDAQASQWDSTEADAAFVAGTGVNADILAYVDANNIFNFKASAATAAGFVESIRKTAQGPGAMQYLARIRFAPAALADMTIKLTTAS